MAFLRAGEPPDAKAYQQRLTRQGRGAGNPRPGNGAFEETVAGNTHPFSGRFERIYVDLYCFPGASEPATGGRGDVGRRRS